MNKPDTQNTLTIVIPTTHNFIVGEEKITRPADSVIRNHVIELVGKTFANRFGGFSIVEQRGGWVDSDTQEIVWENSSVISTLTGKLTESDTHLLADMAQAIAHIFNQDAVLITINGKGWFITQ